MHAAAAFALELEEALALNILQFNIALFAVGEEVFHLQGQEFVVIQV